MLLLDGLLIRIPIIELYCDSFWRKKCVLFSLKTPFLSKRCSNKGVFVERHYTVGSKKREHWRFEGQIYWKRQRLHPLHPPSYFFIRLSNRGCETVRYKEVHAWIKSWVFSVTPTSLHSLHIITFLFMQSEH